MTCATSKDGIEPQGQQREYHGQNDDDGHEIKTLPNNRNRLDIGMFAPIFKPATLKRAPTMRPNHEKSVRPAVFSARACR
jgi:hypothetical protein